MRFSTMTRREQAQTSFAVLSLACLGWMFLYFGGSSLFVHDARDGSPKQSAKVSADRQESAKPALAAPMMAPSGPAAAATAAPASIAVVQEPKAAAAKTPGDFSEAKATVDAKTAAQSAPASASAEATLAAAMSQTLPPPPLAASAPGASASKDACVEWGPIKADVFADLKTKMVANPILRDAAIVREMRYPAIWRVNFSYRTAEERDQIVKSLADKGIRPAEVSKAGADGAGSVILGYFPSQEKAQAVNAAMAARGFNDQVISQAQPERSEANFLFPSPTDETLAALKPFLADSDVALRTVACPAGLPQAGSKK